MGGGEGDCEEVMQWYSEEVWLSGRAGHYISVQLRQLGSEAVSAAVRGCGIYTMVAVRQLDNEAAAAGQWTAYTARKV